MFTKQKCYVLFSFYIFFQKMIFIPINFTFVCYIQFTNGRFLLFVLFSVSMVDCVFFDYIRW